jgi:hypothetical protein
MSPDRLLRVDHITRDSIWETCIMDRAMDDQIRKTLIVAIALGLGLLSGCNPYLTQQKRLAQELRVNIEEYPFPELFPAGYFDEILDPGIPVSDVHELVTGYDLVKICDSYKEVYYYFDSTDEGALRFEILYDDKKNYKELRTEAGDSRTIYTKNCRNGIISEGQIDP